MSAIAWGAGIFATLFAGGWAWDRTFGIDSSDRFGRWMFDSLGVFTGVLAGLIVASAS